jgi:hypothetical protein
VLTATARVVGVVDQDVVVARGADDAVYCLAELLVCGASGMFFSSLFSADCHSRCSGSEFSAAILRGVA